MNIKPIEFQITPDDPFKNDVLDRKPSVEILTELIVSQKESFVLSLDSPWGTGKTTFCNSQQKLEQQVK